MEPTTFSISDQKIEEIRRSMTFEHLLTISISRANTLISRLTWIIQKRQVEDYDSHMRKLKKEIGLLFVSILIICKVYGFSEKDILDTIDFEHMPH